MKSPVRKKNAARNFASRANSNASHVRKNIKASSLQNKAKPGIGHNSQVLNDEIERYMLRRWNISYKMKNKFFERIDIIANELIKSEILSKLPDRPNRDYMARENIISYLRSDDGFGPWIKAGVLTRPIIRELAPRAYTALGNYLRRYELPNDIYIPTKSETVEAEIRASGFAAPDAAEARRAARLSQAMLRRTGIGR